MPLSGSPSAGKLAEGAFVCRVRAMPKYNEIPIEILRESLSYNNDTGALTWRFRPRGHFNTDHAWRRFNSAYFGKPALDSINCRGYRTGACMGVRLLAHRVAWALETGAWPENEIDHIDGDRSNNRIENLRDVSAQTNMKNTPLRLTTSSGHVGISWHSQSKKWQANIGSGRSYYYLGLFADINDAIAARKAAEVKHGFHPTHGRHQH